MPKKGRRSVDPFCITHKIKKDKKYTIPILISHTSMSAAFTITFKCHDCKNSFKSEKALDAHCCCLPPTHCECDYQIEYSRGYDVGYCKRCDTGFCAAIQRHHCCDIHEVDCTGEHKLKPVAVKAV